MALLMATGQPPTDACLAVLLNDDVCVQQQRGIKHRPYLISVK